MLCLNFQQQLMVNDDAQVQCLWVVNITHQTRVLDEAV
jgi:hypothetical protein